MNIFRKAFHFLGIVIPVLFFFKVFDFSTICWFSDNTRSILFYMLSTASISMVIIEILRFRYPAFQRFFVHIAGKILKQSEHKQITSVTPYMLANTILVGFFPREIAILAMTFLVFGDPFAAFIGHRFGRNFILNGRSLEGSLAGIISSIFFGILLLHLIKIFGRTEFISPFWSNSEIYTETYIMLFTGAIIAFIAEAVSAKGLLDDNFLIPMGSGLAMFLFCRIQNIEVDLFPIEKLILPSI